MDDIVSAACKAFSEARAVYPDGEAETPIVDWFDLDAQDAVDFCVLKHPKWDGLSDLRCMEHEAYVAAVIREPMRAAIVTALRAERDAAYRKGAEDMRERAAAVAEAEEVLPDIPSAVTISHLTRVGAVKAAQSGGEAAKIIIASSIRKLEPTP